MKPRLLLAILLWALAFIGGPSATALADAAPAASAPSTAAAPAVASDDAVRPLLAKGQFIWYDSAQDDVKPIKLRETDPTDGLNARPATTLASVLAYLFLAVLAVGIVALLIYLLVKHRPTVTLPELARSTRSSAVERIEALPADVQAHVGDLFTQARKAMEAGDYARAMVFFYSHLLVELDQAHLIRLARGKTNRQYQTELRKHRREGLTRLFGDARACFEDVFFGHYPLAGERFFALWQRWPEVERELREAPR